MYPAFWWQPAEGRKEADVFLIRSWLTYPVNSSAFSTGTSAKKAAYRHVF
jgi:hypothetical protein